MSALPVWVLSDGAPGHLSQSQGIVDALASQVAVQVTQIDLRVRSGFWKRLGRLLLPWIRHESSWLPHIYEISVPSGNPVLIVSSGGNTLLANALLAQKTGAVNVYSGTLKGYPAESYQCIFSVTSLGVANNHVLPLPPVPGELARPLLVTSSEKYIAVLIGGDGAGYAYSERDWRQLADSLVQLARREKARLLLTTSRRTGADVDDLLQQLIPAELLADAAWWSTSPRKVVRQFLQSSVAVVVTEDSLTMVAESIYSGRPVIAVSPGVAAPNANDASALAAYVTRGLLTRSGLADLAEVELPDEMVMVPDVQSEIAGVLMRLLSGKR